MLMAELEDKILPPGPTLETGMIKGCLVSILFVAFSFCGLLVNWSLYFWPKNRGGEEGK